MEIIKERSCCFTGHRYISAAETKELHTLLRREILRLAAEGVDTFLAGGAIGFDTIAAQEVLRVRDLDMEDVRLVLVLPCLGQENRWKPRDIAVYRGLMHQADEVIYTGDEYTPACMFVRNRYMVDHSDRCLCYFKRGNSGTAYTLKYAEKQGLIITNLAGENPAL